MSKLERLNARVAKLLTEAVQEVLEVVKETVSEYQEKTARTQRENENLKRRLLELQDKIKKESAPVPPASGPLPEEKPDTKNCEQDSSLERRHYSGITLTEGNPISSHTPDNGETQVNNEHKSHNNAESQAKCHSAQTSTEYCKSQPEDAMNVTEEPMTSDSANGDAGSFSSNNTCNTHSSSQLEVNLAAVKREAEPTDCMTSEALLSLQEQNPGCVDLSCNSSRHIPAQTLRLQVAAPEPYGLIFVHSKNSMPRRHGFAKPNRAAFDVRKFKRENFRGDESHPCVVCGKTFTRIGNLRIHQRCHTGEKPYGCIQCGRRFSQAGDLKKHKRVHTGEKPYYCSQCGKSFSRGENLKRHQKIHIGETLQLQQAWRD